MEGILSMLKLTIGDPSVDAIAIPPLFAVVSVETSLPEELVVNPRTISASFTLNVSVNNVAEVPPTVIFPVTFKLLLTCKSLPIVTFPPIVGFVTKLIVGVEPSPVPLLTAISLLVPLIELT